MGGVEGEREGEEGGAAGGVERWLRDRVGRVTKARSAEQSQGALTVSGSRSKQCFLSTLHANAQLGELNTFELTIACSNRLVDLLQALAQRPEVAGKLADVHLLVFRGTDGRERRSPPLLSTAAAPRRRQVVCHHHQQVSRARPSRRRPPQVRILFTRIPA